MMGPDKITRADRVSTEPQAGVVEGAEERANSESATEKRKGKEVPSTADRMRSSGRALLNSALGDLPALGAQTGQKGAGDGVTSSSYQAHQSVYGSQGSSKGAIFASSSRTFKPTNDAKTANPRFDAFAQGSGIGESAYLEHTTAQLPEAARSSPQSTVDGIDVVRLLSQPEGCELSPPSEDYDFTPVGAVGLQQGLFGSETAWPFWDQLLNFNPEFLVKPEPSSTETKAYVGTSNLEEARNIWLQQWNEVLTSYADDVWGDLGPLAKAAKIEIARTDQDKADKGPSFPALERLRLVLAHVRGH
ncbi:hypothetical protein E4U42_003323 [Claviceps africana]|uniref:Uncharacterized protein n=1 Tax=Claviceps africana TaxID=83212 RepID=A0A8K0JEI8_9HYPO|nr:hypothetical protein E4U42_003323 [Claviceps africana]